MGYAAWQGLGLRANPVIVFGPDGGVKVLRDRTGRPVLNFKALEEYVHYFGGSLGTKRPDFSVGPTPQVLSSNPRDKHYQYYSPQSYDEWRDVVGQSVKYIKEHLRMEGATYWLQHLAGGEDCRSQGEGGRPRHNLPRHGHQQSKGLGDVGIR
ncbi:MAG: hypothetical protein ACT4PY_15700 [Armatimonadota bacterium]